MARRGRALRRGLQVVPLLLLLLSPSVSCFLYSEPLLRGRRRRTQCRCDGPRRALSTSWCAGIDGSHRRFVPSNNSPIIPKPGRRRIRRCEADGRLSAARPVEQEGGPSAASPSNELEPREGNIPTTNAAVIPAAMDATAATIDNNASDGVPSVAQILRFAIPAIGVWLCSPLLSMIDTSVVGLFSGTLQQAALHPAVAVTDYSARAMSFLYTGTTNLVATSRQQQLQQQAQALRENDDGIIGGARDDDVANNTPLLLEQTFVGALRMALLVGSGLGIALFVGATPLTRALMGNGQHIDPEVGRAAARYVRIRALGMPAAAMIGTSQAACLGLRDVRSPLRVIAVAALVNLVSDLALVGRPHPWIGGAAGAAWATAFSQYFAMALFWKWLTTRASPPKDETSTSSAQSTSEPPTDLPSEPAGRLMMVSRVVRSVVSRRRPRQESFSTRGLLAGHLDRQSLFQRPSDETTSGYRPYVVPVTTTQVGRCSTYIAMGHVVSSSFGTVSMAANQVITSIFYSLIPIADSLSLTMQSFLPGIVIREPAADRAKALRTTITNLYKCAGLFGLALSGAVACIPFASRFFTTDPAVAAAVASIVPILFVIFSLHGVFCGSEGLLLGQRDLTFLGRMYAVYFCVVPYLMLRIKYVAQRATATALGGRGPRPPTLRSVWSLFLAYQLFRISVWVGRVLWLQNRAEKHATDTQQPKDSLHTRITTSLTSISPASSLFREWAVQNSLITG